MKKLNYKIILIILLLTFKLTAEDFIIGRIKYNGGGDWYADKTSLPNVLNNLKIKFKFNNVKEKNISIVKEEIFQTPFLYITGHGNIKLNDEEINVLREHLTNGGFLYIDDCYGLNKSIRKVIKKVFPESKLTKLKFTNKIYHSYYNFDDGLPKIHEHDGIPPEGYGIYYKKKLVLFYSYNSDIGCGVEDAWVHNDPENLRKKAMNMFTNVIFYYLLY